jgi:cyclohexa-1,5-dienecarbonyl-CoA hydratase
MKSDKVRKEFTHDGQVARIILTAPKANILDRAMMLEFIGVLRTLTACGNLKAIIVSSQGPHFSFGASIEEHLPGQIRETLELLRAVLEELAAAPAPTIAAVRGQCLGGGFELALACDLIVAEENAQFGLPEIKLGVFPPAGAALLPVRIGASRAAELIITGKSWSAASALQAGLIHKMAPAGALDAYIEEWVQADVLPRSATALRYAAQAVRRPLVHTLKVELPELERMYLDGLMLHPDAAEGIQSFLDKRQPHWAASH